MLQLCHWRSYCNLHWEVTSFREFALWIGSLLMFHDIHWDSNLMQTSDTELCGICFDQVCTIEVQNCGHQMCAQCTLALCCHNKPNPMTACPTVPVCPFCRSSIVQLIVAKVKAEDCTADQELDVNSPKFRKSRRSWNLSEGSSSFKGLSAVSTIGKMVGRGSGRIAFENEWIDKPLSIESWSWSIKQKQKNLVIKNW